MEDEGLTAAVHDAGGLVNYQPESVVSRTLLKTAGGSLTAFAFDRGQGLSEHSVPHEALVVVLEGSAEIDVGTTTHEVASGELLQLPADVSHALRATSRFKMLHYLLKNPA
jgi:quercetin dioxygenase-like cupin family protein